MSVPINTGTFPKALQVGVNTFYGEAYGQYEVQYTDIFTTETSKKNFEEDVGISGFGLAQLKPEGSGINYDTMTQGFTTRYTHQVFALGFKITREMVEDDQYGFISKKRAQALARSMRQTKDTNGANVLNRAFTAGFVGGDGIILSSNAHVNVAGGTWSNILTTAANLSEAALEQATIDIMRFTDDRGLKINVRPQALIIPPDLVYEANRILESQGRVGTPNNDVNVLKMMGKIPKIIVNQYLTSQKAYWLQTDVQDGLKYFERRADSFDLDNEFDTENMAFKATGRYVFGWTDPRAVYGTPGV